MEVVCAGTHNNELNKSRYGDNNTSLTQILNVTNR